MLRFNVLLAAAAIGTGDAALAQQRLPVIPASDYSEEQKLAAAQFEAARRSPVFGPFEILMHSPQLMTQARAMGDYLRFKPSIGTTLSELAILITARAWSQDYEWTVHYPIALKAGIAPELAQAIAEGRHPEAMSDDEDIVYEFCRELHANKAVSDRTYQRAEKRFGRQGVVDLAGISGYYTLLAMELNMAQYEIPKDGRRLPRLPSR